MTSSTNLYPSIDALLTSQEENFQPMYQPTIDFTTPEFSGTSTNSRSDSPPPAYSQLNFDEEGRPIDVIFPEPSAPPHPDNESPIPPSPSHSQKFFKDDGQVLPNNEIDPNTGTSSQQRTASTIKEITISSINFIGEQLTSLSELLPEIATKSIEWIKNISSDVAYGVKKLWHSTQSAHRAHFTVDVRRPAHYDQPSNLDLSSVPLPRGFHE